MAMKLFDVVAILINILQFSRSENILSCDPHAVEPCPGSYQRCNATTSVCDCEAGFVKIGNDCEPPVPNSTDNGATVAVVVIFTLALLICGLILVVRKYNLVDYVWQKINLRRDNNIMYEDVMIGQDDPPLSP